MLHGDVADAAESVQSSFYERWNVEEYAAENMPLHRIRAGMAGRAAGVLASRDFCTRRVVALGPVEAARRHVSDLVDLRRAHSHHKEQQGDPDQLDVAGTVQE